MITVKCPACRDWELTAAFGNGLLDELREHQADCPDEWGINFLKEKNRMRLQAPNTREVEMCYVADVYTEPHFTKSELRESADVAKAEFKLWLDQVKADAWDEGWNAGASWPQDDTNPYRKQEEV